MPVIYVKEGDDLIDAAHASAAVFHSQNHLINKKSNQLWPHLPNI